jgi:outer membrane murein-binding lipoprotein Lpp
MNAMNSPDLPIRDYADFLIGCIELAVKHIADPRERLARQVGMLQSEVLRLSAEVDALRRDEVATEEQS